MTTRKTIGEVKPVRVLVVDDSQTARMLLVRTLEAHDGIRVVGQAKDGAEAVALTRDLKPDLITMDVRMPTMDGLQATEQIMAQFPTPIVIVSSSVDAPDLQITFKALAAGALDIIEKPRIADVAGFDTIRRLLVDSVRTMSEVRVVRRRMSPASSAPVPELDVKPYHLIAIGASTGGPQLLCAILGRLDPKLPVPVVVVQHMAMGFTEGFARWLDQETGLDVKIAADGEPLLPGTVYVAPDQQHLRVTPRFRVALGGDDPVGGFRPSVDALFESVAGSVGGGGIGLLLTGMGSDGAAGMARIRSAGGYTIAQDSASCVVAGMPDAARDLGAVTRTLTPDVIPSFLTALTERR